jgi:superfamily II DNA or RNA helicase
MQRKGIQPPAEMNWQQIGSIWPNQLDALDTLARFFKATPNGASLMQMPTGSGKTTIIAIAARIRAQETRKAVLVLSPSAALSEQLRFDIEEGVWARLEVNSPWTDLTVTTLLRSNRPNLTAALKDASTRPQVLIGTLQALHDIRGFDAALYAKIRAMCSAAFVDEGHREPAEQWSKSVEALGTPIILFSATPYRNDMRIFHVDPKFVEYRSFNWAVSEKLIRDVRFETMDVGRDAGSFAAASARRLIEMEAAGDVLADAKAILRFSDQAAIRAALAALKTDANAVRLGYVAVHEEFTEDAEPMLRHITDLRKRSERLFLHQFKLSEGVDEPRCSVLFLHDDFRNERLLVQQIGRCVRRVAPRSKVQSEPDAVVVTLPTSRAAASWDAYRAFDLISEKTGMPPILDEEKYGRMLRQLDVPVEYTGRKFRLAVPADLDAAPFDADDPKRKRAELALAQDVLIPRRCIVYDASPMGTFDGEVASVKLNLEESGRQIIASVQPYPEDFKRLHVIVCHVIEPSPLFDRFTFLENRYTVSVVYGRGDRIFFYDSSELEMGEETPVGPAELAKLLPERESTRVTLAATKNTDISRHAARSREVSAASLRDTPPTLTDFMGVLSRVRGHIESNSVRSSRYIGFFSGRVTDGRSAGVDIHEFVDWCGTIEADLNAVGDSAHVFRRYAQPIPQPVDPRPLNILLDLSQLGTSFRSIVSSEDLLLEDYCANLTPSGNQKWSFSVSVVPKDTSNATISVACTLTFEDSGRFKLHSDDLALYVSTDEKPMTAVDALNRAQAFRIVLGNGKEAYGYHQFYSVAPSLEGMRGVISDLLLSDPAFALLASEKGDTMTSGTKWDANSLFGLIDKNGGRLPLRQFEGAWSALICDDLGEELADFIAYRMNPPAIALIHAKRPRKKMKLSASSLHDVLAQAVKNLDWVRIGGSGIPSAQADKWEKAWKLRNRSVVRSRLGSDTIATHVARIGELLASASTQRHVCIAIAGGVSRSRLLKELAKEPPSVVSIQAFLLLTAFYAEALSVGLIPTVVCD